MLMMNNINQEGWAKVDLNIHPTDDGHQEGREALPDLNVHPNARHQAVGEAISALNVRPTDEHQADREAIPDLNAQPTDIAQLADRDVAFDVPDQQDDVDLNLLFPAQYEGRNQISDALFEAMEEDMPEYGVYTEEMDIVFNQDELPHSNNGDVPANTNVHSRSKDLTPTQRQQIYEALLERSVNGKLKKNSTKRVDEMFKVHQAAVWRIWKRAKKCCEKGIPVDISSRKPKNSGRKRAQVDLSQVQTIPLRRRSTLRSLAEALDADKSTIHRLFKRGLLRRHSNTIKPYLTKLNKKERLWWCVSMLDTSTLNTQPKFVEMDNIIHLDEKWYNATKKKMTYYLHPDEEDPHRTVRNKNGIGKVMFLTAVAKPRYDDQGNCTFDGKIGIWPFVRKEPAKRRSGNRPRGTLITKTMTVYRDTMRSYLIGSKFVGLEKIWGEQLQGCLIDVMKAGGGNKYKIPHMNKERLEDLGLLPRSPNCDSQLYESVMESLRT